MTLSTLRSKRGVPGLALLLLVVAGVAWVLAALYTLYLNPEIRDFTAGAKIKAHWNEQLRTRYPANYIVFGGSSSSFSVDPAFAESEFHMPVSNLALGAGLGAKVLTRYAASHTHSGDTLVMTMEPSLFSGSMAVPQLGEQFTIAMGQLRWASESSRVQEERFPGLNRTFGTCLSALRPGGSHFVTLIAKIALRRPLYRYGIGEFTATGQKITDVRMPLSAPRGLVKLSPDAEAFLADLKKWSETNDVHVVYTLPWAYCPPEELYAFQQENRLFLEQMIRYFPVLPERRLGAYTNQAHFADTAYHLTREGARIRTQELVSALKAERIVSSNQLSMLH